MKGTPSILKAFGVARPGIYPESPALKAEALTTSSWVGIILPSTHLEFNYFSVPQCWVYSFKTHHCITGAVLYMRECARAKDIFTNCACIMCSITACHNFTPSHKGRLDVARLEKKQQKANLLSSCTFQTNRIWRNGILIHLREV